MEDGWFKKMAQHCNASSSPGLQKVCFSVDVAIITGKLKTWSKWGLGMKV